MKGVRDLSLLQGVLSGTDEHAEKSPFIGLFSSLP